MNRSIPVLALIALLPSLSFAKSGPEIPRPKVSLCEAAGKVEEYFRKTFGDERPDAAFDRFKGECIVQSAEYTNWLSKGDFDEKPGDPNLQLGGWYWIVTIIHPRQNDRAWVFQLGDDGTVKLLRESR